MSVVRGPGDYSGGGGDPVGATEVALLAGVQLKTVQRWRERHADFPAPTWEVGGRPAWRVGDIDMWLYRTGRHPRYRTPLVERVIERLRAAGGAWVTRDDLLTLAPERVEGGGYAHELDDAETPGPSWAYGHDATGVRSARRTGQPDGQALDDALSRARKLVRVDTDDDGTQPCRIEEGYPDGGPRSFRLVPR